MFQSYYIEYENSEVIFKINLRELALWKLEETLVPCKPPHDYEKGMDNIIMKEIGKMVRRIQM